MKIIRNHYVTTSSNGLAATLKIMDHLENKSLHDQGFINFIYNRFSHLKSCNDCLFTALWKFVLTNFQYQTDEYDETLISPAKILFIKKGDCDDFALFIHTALTALGYKPFYLLLGEQKNKPTHIAVLINGKVIDGTNKIFNKILPKYRFQKKV